VDDPRAEVGRIGRLLGRGRDEQTPLYAHNAVFLGVALLVLVVLAIVLVVYYST
jgi:hypothetical protein